MSLKIFARIKFEQKIKTAAEINAEFRRRYPEEAKRRSEILIASVLGLVTSPIN